MSFSRVSAKTADNTTGFVGTDQLAANDIQYTFTDIQNEPVRNPTDVGTYTVKCKLGYEVVADLTVEIKEA